MVTLDGNDKAFYSSAIVYSAGTSEKKKTLTEDVLHEWQNMLNDTAETVGVPAGLITRVDGKEIEILLSSEAEGNPYSAACTSGWSNKSREWLNCPFALF